MKRSAVFLDRDGTINEDPGYPSNCSQVKIFPASFEAVKKFNRASLLTIVVTNQSGIGRGLFSEDDLSLIHEKMRQAFSEQGARLDAFYFCPHYESSQAPRYRQVCDCRKPNPGLALQAANDFGIDLEHSYMVGDKTEDMVFGANIKATPVLVLTGTGREARVKLKEMGFQPAHVAADILAAAEWILERERTAARPGR